MNVQVLSKAFVAVQQNCASMNDLPQQLEEGTCNDDSANKPDVVNRTGNVTNRDKLSQLFHTTDTPSSPLSDCKSPIENLEQSMPIMDDDSSSSLVESRPWEKRKCKPYTLPIARKRRIFPNDVLQACWPFHWIHQDLGCKWSNNHDPPPG